MAGDKPGVYWLAGVLLFCALLPLIATRRKNDRT